MKHRIGLAIAALCALATASASSAAHAQEVSTAAAFDQLYGTRFSSVGGLPTLRREMRAPMPAEFTVRELRYLEVLGFDTSGTNALKLVAAGREAVLFDPGPWTPPSRGWRPGAAGPIDLARVLSEMGLDPANTRFSLAVGEARMDASNTVLLRAPNGGECVLGYNDGGVDAADSDLNEPVLRARRDDGAPAPLFAAPVVVWPQPYAPRVAPATTTAVMPMTVTVNVALVPTTYGGAAWAQPAPVARAAPPGAPPGTVVFYTPIASVPSGAWTSPVRVPQRVWWW